MGMGVNGGIERKIEFSVEQEAGSSRPGSAGGGGPEAGWDRDVEREGGGA